MSVHAVEGGAGCGKTYRLMELLTERLDTHPLSDGQRVLALTFMHGSRRRLAERLRTVPNLKGRVECQTIDSFAWRIYRRWRGLAAVMGIAGATESDFDSVCDAAGMLLEQPDVRAWVGTSFPVVLVDEGQDLSLQRLRMLRAICDPVHLLIAADEFQCLHQGLRPNPFVTWIQSFTKPETLVRVRRTNAPGLLAAASAIRGGNAPENATGAGFRILTPGVSVPLAATLLANAIAWRSGGNVAVITPSLQGGFAQSIIARVGQGPCGSRGNGPFSIHWEGNDRDEAQVILAELDLGAAASASAARNALRALTQYSPARAALSWVENQINACGRTDFTRTEIEFAIARQVSLNRQRGGGLAHMYTAMTVQQAKNREFDGVVIIWPYQVGGDSEHKRRLLYNAVTRAKRWCNIIVQNQSILAAAPFA